MYDNSAMLHTHSHTCTHMYVYVYIKQGFTRNRLIACFKKFYGRHSVLVNGFKVSITNIIIDLFLETLYS